MYKEKVHLLCNVTLFIGCLTGRLSITIERLDSLNVIIRKHEVVFAGVGIDRKHQGSWVLGVVQT